MTTLIFGGICMKKQRILLVEDEYNVADTLNAFLKKEGYDVTWHSSGEKALDHLSKNHCDMAILDIGLPGISGLEVLKQINQKHSDTISVMLTASDSASTAVDALKIGAFDYITKPFELGQISLVVKKALQAGKDRKGKQTKDDTHRFKNLIGNTPIMKNIYQKIHQAANSTADVLLLGETGTGKEIVAKTIHKNSKHKDKPFKAVNCSAIPETLIESALFGHEKGAFTGAVSTKQGAIELAHDGTLFLDEIGDFKPELQVKLLRALEERKITRIGGNKEIPVNIRLICATNKDLKSLVKNHKFREDLYYRINTFPIELPLLKDRKDDIPLLVGHFLDLFENSYGKHFLSPGAVEVLNNYDWPGNIRELKNTIERILTSLHGGKQYTIYVDHIPNDIKDKKTTICSTAGEGNKSLKELLEPVEKCIIQEVLTKTNGSISQTAQLLKISYPTLKQKMKNLGIK